MVLSSLRALITPSTCLAYCLFGACLILSGCARYQVTLNETPVYTPPPLFTQFDTRDPQLKRCLDQAIKDGQYRSATAVSRLICSHAGLTSLEGIEQFRGLKEIDIRDNRVQSLEPLRYLSQLEVLLVSDNQLSDAAVLLTLPALSQVHLDNNPELGCDNVHQWHQHYQGEARLPGQCL
ncbi:leucine-rich repeat domain-containing protein [Pseudomaricurvus alkylphenolicus]|uniref:leucine-rich repeat domain-containing protein n=1 Tax=Pseudomaricurvus alkylphenolicus TaxID=1306991 RepID=UPI001423F6D9|nr:leucine-rich repeat domain-containing protein [Pseudomaricurvus alkylphenolicus]NIB42039.1 leucine-rich repeat domain-containing protein [Pseudomaricurvus alkylphenolicus]